MKKKKTWSPLPEKLENTVGDTHMKENSVPVTQTSWSHTPCKLKSKHPWSTKAPWFYYIREFLKVIHCFSLFWVFVAIGFLWLRGKGLLCSCTAQALQCLLLLWSTSICVVLWSLGCSGFSSHSTWDWRCGSWAQSTDLTVLANRLSCSAKCGSISEFYFLMFFLPVFFSIVSNTVLLTSPLKKLQWVVDHHSGIGWGEGLGRSFTTAFL